MTVNGADADPFARRLLVQAGCGVAAIVVAALLAITVGAGLPGYGRILVLAVFVLFGGVAVLLSVILVFDALLFRLIASHESEAGGCAAVDDLLARMQLKPRPGRLRHLAERVAGTRRLMRYHLMALAVCIAACLAFISARSP